MVLDLDGKYHQFPDRQAAQEWLNEDEYSLLAHVIADGEVVPEVSPPTASSDRELVPLMAVRVKA